MLVICAVYDRMLLWVEIVLFVSRLLFSLFFAYALKNKWHCLQEEHYWKAHFVNKKEARETNIFFQTLSCALTTGFCFT